MYKFLIVNNKNNNDTVNIAYGELSSLTRARNQNTRQNINKSLKNLDLHIAFQNKYQPPKEFD